MTRFFLPAERIRGNQVYLEGSDYHHLVKVLRKTVGDEIHVLDGKGTEFTARINAINAEAAIAEIIDSTGRQTEPRVKLNLVQSLPKADKFEWILQKNTELGVSSFQPLISERSIIKLDAAAKAKKEERWRKIISEAAEQSGRGIIPELRPVREWDMFLQTFPGGLVLLPWEGERETSLRQVLTSLKEPPLQVNVIIGPEGGFAQEEVESLQKRGAVPLTLGPRILRTETAGLVVAAAILYQYGELG